MTCTYTCYPQVDNIYPTRIMHGHSSALSLSQKNHDKDVQSVYPLILSATCSHPNAEFATVTVTFLELLADVDER